MEILYMTSLRSKTIRLFRQNWWEVRHPPHLPLPSQIICHHPIIECSCAEWMSLEMPDAKWGLEIRRWFWSRDIMSHVFPYVPEMNQYSWPPVAPLPCLKRENVSFRDQQRYSRRSTRWTWNLFTSTRCKYLSQHHFDDSDDDHEAKDDSLSLEIVTCTSTFSLKQFMLFFSFLSSLWHPALTSSLVIPHTWFP